MPTLNFLVMYSAKNGKGSVPPILSTKCTPTTTQNFLGNSWYRLASLTYRDQFMATARASGATRRDGSTRPTAAYRTPPRDRAHRLLSLLSPLDVALDCLELGLKRRFEHAPSHPTRLSRAPGSPRASAQGGDLVGQHLRVREFFGNLVGEERSKLLPVRPLHHAGVEPVHDDGLKLPLQIFVEPIDQLLASIV